MSILFCGMDVHKDSVVVAVLPEAAAEPTKVVRLMNDDRKLKRFFQRLISDGEIRACYEASGSGYVLQRRMSDWGYACEVVAPSLTPQRPGQRRKHDKRDASQLAHLYRAGELVTIRVPDDSVGPKVAHGTMASLTGFRYLRAWAAEIEEFIAAIREDRDPAVSGDDGVRVLEITDAILQSGRTGRAVEL